MKKAIAVATALLMVLPLLAACASGTSAATTAPAATTPTATTQTETTPAAASTAPAATETPANQSLCPYSGPTVTYTVFAGDAGVKEDVNSPVYQIYKKAVGNIDIKWDLVPGSDLDTKAKLYLNSGDIPDIMCYYGPGGLDTYSDLFLDLNQYKQYMPNWTAAVTANPALLSYQTADGKAFIMQNIDNDYPGESWYANMTELNKCGITSVPTTLDELIADMQKVKETDPDVTPFHTMWGINYVRYIFASCLNAKANSTIYLDSSDNKWKLAVAAPESKYKDLITLLADFYSKGYFNAEFSTMSDDQTQQLMASSKWAFTFTYFGQIFKWYQIDTINPLPVDVEPFLPVAADGVKPSIPCAYVSDNPYWGLAASAKIKNPELAVSWMDTMLGKEVSTAFQWGIEGTSYTVDASGKESWIPSFIAQGSQASLDLGIWNIMGPRYVTTRDDASLLGKYSALDQKAEKLMADALTNGTLVSYYGKTGPTIDTAASDELSSIMTPVNTKIQQGVAEFILGKRPISQWDDFVKEVLAAGDIDRALEIYTNAPQGHDRATSAERHYISP